MDSYPLSKLKAPRLSVRKWTKLLMMVLHGLCKGTSRVVLSKF